MKRIAIDMDGVLADTLPVELAWFRQHFGYRFEPSDLVGKRVFEDLVSPEHLAAERAMLCEGSFFADLPVMPGAVAALRRLAARHQVFVASSAIDLGGAMAAKLGWLERHFPFIPAWQVVFCGDKSILAADVLIDDNAHQWTGFQGRRLLFDAPHNVHETRCTRVSSWAEVERLLLGEPVAAAG